MVFGARRPAARPWHRFARRVLLMLCFWLAGPVAANTFLISGAFYADPTSRYPHGVLGDDLEYETLVLTLSSGKILRYRLPDTLVFEDTAPRLLDTGGKYVAVVESHHRLGSRLAVYDRDGRVAATPFIGTRFRWLAPVGAADLDADGHLEIAYVDRPHLARTLRIWRFKERALTPLVEFPGVTNHRIGEQDIAGGFRDCGGGPEMILADGGWQSLLVLRFDGLEIAVRRIGSDTSRPAFDAAMACRGG